MSLLESVTSVFTVGCGGRSELDEESQPVVRAQVGFFGGALDEGVHVDEEGMKWFEGCSHFNLKKLLAQDASTKRNAGSNAKIKVPPGLVERVNHRLAEHGRLARPVPQDASSLYHAIAFALGRRRESSHLNIRGELVEYIKSMGDTPVIEPEQYARDQERKEGFVNHDLNLLKSMFQKVGWSQYIKELAEVECPGNQVMLLAACCVFKAKICLISADADPKYDEPIWLCPPEHWRTTAEDWRVPMERSPIYVAHLHGCQFYAVETQAQNARNKLRSQKLEHHRRVAAEKMDRMAATAAGEDEEALPVIQTYQDTLKDELASVLLPARATGDTEPTQEQLLQNEKVSDLLKTLEGDDLFELLFEYKCIFDVFDYDSSGNMRLDEIVRAFRSYGVDLQSDVAVQEGGYGKGPQKSLGFVKRRLHNDTITFTEFAKHMLADKSSIHPMKELRELIEHMEPSKDPYTDQERVRVDQMNQVLSSFGVDLLGEAGLQTLEDENLKDSAEDGGQQWIYVHQLEEAFMGAQS